MKTLTWISFTIVFLCALSCSNSSTGPASQTPGPSNPNAQAAPSADQKNAPALMVITGRLMKKDGAPAPNIKLWIGSAVREGKKFTGVKPEFYKGLMVFPGATTETDGRFQISWERDFFLPDHEYALAIEDIAGRRSGVLNATFKIESGVNRIDLGDISSNL